MTDITSRTTAELQALLASCTEALTSVAESLKRHPDMQEAILSMLTANDMLHTLIQLAENHSDLANQTLQTAVTALVNTQS